MGYHLKKIKKGKLGEFSKIKEETEELKDAIKQKNKILELCELADLTGSIIHYLNKQHPNISIEDLIEMARATDRAFRDGDR